MRSGSRAMVGLGVLAVVAGIAVLVSRASRMASFGWFAYSPPDPGYLDSLVAVNGTRALGAGLVLVGLVVVALRTGLTLAAGPRRPARTAVVGFVILGAGAVVGGLFAMALPRRFVVVGSELPLVTPSRATGGFGFPTVVLTPVQVADLGLVVAGLLLLGFSAGLAVGGRAQPRG